MPKLLTKEQQANMKRANNLLGGRSDANVTTYVQRRSDIEVLGEKPVHDVDTKDNQNTVIL